LVQRSIPDALTEGMSIVLNNPRKCIEITRVSPKEFKHILVFVNAEIRARGGRSSGHYRECKLNIRHRLWSVGKKQELC
jgi:ribose 1,5-bisphosphokinase PhnN